MSDEPDVEAQLRRAILLRRTITGVGAVAFGLAALVLGVLMVVLTFQGALGRRGMIRIGLMGLVLGVIFVSGGVRTLLRGETDPTTGQLLPDQRPVPWPVVGGASLVLAVALSAIAAWPLGLYTWLGTLDSGCRDVLTAEELTSIAGREIVLDDVSDQSDDLHCTATFVDASGTPVAAIELGGDLGGGQFENHLDFVARGTTPTPIAGLGDEAHRIEREGGTVIAVRRGHAGLFVQLTSAFSAEAATRATDLVGTRLDVMAPYAARWVERYGPE